jgi:flagellar motor switch protein FliM
MGGRPSTGPSEVVRVSVNGPTLSPPSPSAMLRDGRDVTGTYDFRRPTTFAREHVRSLAVAHEVFVRRFASGLNSALRTVVQMEPLSVEQMSYDDYIRSMPNPTVLTTISLAPLPAAAVLEMNVQLALVLVDRMLGGQGVPVPPRRPTEVETHLLEELVGHGLAAFSETLKPLAEVTAHIGDVDYNPQLVQVVAPSEVVLLLTYRVTIAQGARSEGLLTICYPYSTLGPALNQLSNNLWLDQSLPAGQPVSTAPLRSEVPAVPVRLTVQADPVSVPARDIAALRPGDVLRLDHPADHVLRGTVEGTDVVAGHLGRRGRRLAFQVVEWRARPETPQAHRPTDTPDGPRTVPDAAPPAAHDPFPEVPHE